MTKEELKEWQAVMGFTQQRAADALGVGLSAYKDWSNGYSRTTKNPMKIEKRTALACAALLLKIPPYGV